MEFTLRAGHFILLVVQFVLSPPPVQSSDSPTITTIYQFGDSIADTGNLIREGTLGYLQASANSPYGETYFHRGTGRYSDGRLIVDFIAAHYGLPFLSPYHDTLASFKQGVNFAVAGATALPSSFFLKNQILVPHTSSSLDVQLRWFETHLNSICSHGTDTDCRHRLKQALFLLGEIGGNDFNYAFFQGKPMNEVESYQPLVIEAIIEAARTLINYGAANLMIPGNFPIGCVPAYLTEFSSTTTSSYDSRGCLRDFNSFSQQYNARLQIALHELRQQFPQVNITYGDYYNAFFHVFDNASSSLEFDHDSLLRACCGEGGLHNFNPARMCGAPAVPVCPNPSTHLSWDGIHMTDHAYSLISAELLSPGMRF